MSPFGSTRSSVVVAGMLLAVILPVVTTSPANADALCGADALAVTVYDGYIGLVHSHAEYNCCTWVTRELTVEGNQLVVTETESWVNPCYCDCCFELAATIRDVPAGEWNVVVRWLDEAGDWRSLIQPVTMSGDPAKTDPSLAWLRRSGCGGTAGVPVDLPGEPVTASWSALKAAYR